MVAKIVYQVVVALRPAQLSAGIDSTGSGRRGHQKAAGAGSMVTGRWPQQVMLLIWLLSTGATSQTEMSQEDAHQLLQTLKNHSNRSAQISDDEMMGRIMEMVVQDASIIRLPNTEANSSEECTWPSCSAYCVPCAKTNKYWTCLSSGSKCQENSECIMGACFALPGYCYADAYPQKARCYMGARAPKVRFHNSLILRLGAAPPVPLPEATAEEWAAWANSCIWVPLVLMAFSFFVAYKLCWVIEFSKGDQFVWLPHTRHGIICFSVFCLLFFWMLQVVRFFLVRTDIRQLENRMDRLQTSLRHFQDLTDDLVEAEKAYNQSLMFAPDSCGPHNPLATEFVKLLAGGLQSEFQQVDLILEIVRETLDTLMVLLARGKTNLHSFGYALTYYPIFPAVVMLLGMAALLCIAGYAWNRPKTLVNPWFQGALKFLSPCIVIFVLFCGLCASLCFYVSILVTGYCYNVDENLQVASSRVQFQDVVAQKVNVEPILQHTAAYYLQGVNVNPLATLLQNFEAALYTVKRFYKMFEWLVDMGAASCPGLKQLSPEPLLESLLQTSYLSDNFISAENMWPYYQSIVHKTVCHHFPRNGMGLVFICILIGFFFCPAIAITISNHLKYMSFGMKVNELAREEGHMSPVKANVGAVGVLIQSRLSELSTSEQALLLESLQQDVSRKFEEEASPTAAEKTTDTDSEGGTDRMC